MTECSFCNHTEPEHAKEGNRHCELPLCCCVAYLGPKPDERRVTDAGAELGLAFWLLEELGMPASNSDRVLVAECIRLLAKQGGTVKNAADFILHAARQEEQPITIWFFRDRKYLPKTPPNPGVYNEAKRDQLEAQRAAEEQEGYVMWQGMSEQFKAANPWRAA